MKIGGSIALIAIGAILCFAVQDAIAGIDLTTVGYILMGAGVLALILSVAFGRPKPLTHSSESRTINDPNSGETIRRTEMREE